MSRAFSRPAYKQEDRKKGVADFTSDPSLILEKIRYFCSYRERSEKEAELKLRSFQVPAGKIRGILDQLSEEGFISDERFARAFVRGKWRVNKWGRIRITFELRAKRVQEKLISSALEEIDEDSYRLVLGDLISKKAKDIRPQKKGELNSGKSLNFRDKLFTFALGKGYESDLILKTLDELKF
ncbi:MAG: regulatory protein RecX [Bacteroidetes bacterium]|nr:regulatory protein RecX [Bacteroidota bacterium]